MSPNRKEHQVEELAIRNLHGESDKLIKLSPDPSNLNRSGHWRGVHHGERGGVRNWGKAQKKKNILTKTHKKLGWSLNRQTHPHSFVLQVPPFFLPLDT